MAEQKSGLLGDSCVHFQLELLKAGGGAGGGPMIPTAGHLSPISLP